MADSDQQSAVDASRRKFLAVASGAGALALAGCTSSGDDDGSSGNGGDNGGENGMDNGGENGMDNGGENGMDNGSENGTDGELSGTIDIAGSSTVFPIMEAVGATFEGMHDEVSINLQSTGSGGGFANFFCTGDNDFNNASRPIKEEEQAQCEENSVEYIELTVATDALTVVVNNNADFIDSITIEELAQIWEADAAETWQEVNSDWPDKEIARFGAADTSGTYDYFIENVQGAERGHTDDYQATEQDNQIAQGVQGDTYAIGYFGFSYYFQNQDQLKALAIDDGNGATLPSLETAASGEYQPLSRSLFTYPSVSSLQEEHVAEFARFVLEKSTDESLIAEQVGYVPNTEEKMQEEMEELENAIDQA